MCIHIYININIYIYICMYICMYSSNIPYYTYASLFLFALCLYLINWSFLIYFFSFSTSFFFFPPSLIFPLQKTLLQCLFFSVHLSVSIVNISGRGFVFTTSVALIHELLPLGFILFCLLRLGSS